MTFAEIPHSAACVKHQEWIKDHEVRTTRWRQAHPRYCRACDGRGVILYEAGDASVGLGPEYGYCDDCVLKGKCPRCGEQHGNLITHENEPSDFFTCVVCGYVLDGNQECVASLMDGIAYMDSCICIDERYAQWVKAHPMTRHEEALEMGMTDKEAAEYSRTGELPDSYLARADREYDAWRERHDMRRF